MRAACPLHGRGERGDESTAAGGVAADTLAILTRGGVLTQYPTKSQRATSHCTSPIVAKTLAIESCKNACDQSFLQANATTNHLTLNGNGAALCGGPLVSSKTRRDQSAAQCVIAMQWSKHEWQSCPTPSMMYIPLSTVRHHPHGIGPELPIAAVLLHGALEQQLCFADPRAELTHRRPAWPRKPVVTNPATWLPTPLVAARQHSPTCPNAQTLVQNHCAAKAMRLDPGDRH